MAALLRTSRSQRLGESFGSPAGVVAVDTVARRLLPHGLH